MEENVPTMPHDCNIAVGWEEKFYAAEMVPGYSGKFGGPPDSWEPPEPSWINAIYQWNNQIGDWEPLPDVDAIPSPLEEKLWQEFNSQY